MLLCTTPWDFWYVLALEKILKFNWIISVFAFSFFYEQKISLVFLGAQIPSWNVALQGWHYIALTKHTKDKDQKMLKRMSKNKKNIFFLLWVSRKDRQNEQTQEAADIPS